MEQIDLIFACPGGERQTSLVLRSIKVEYEIVRWYVNIVHPEINKI